MQKRHSNRWRRKTPKPPLPWGTWTLSNGLIPESTPLTTPNDISIGSRIFAQLHHKSPLVAMGCPTFTPKLPLLLRRSQPPSSTLIPQPTHSPSQTASKSNQPFLYNSSTGQTDRQTDRPTDRQTDRPTNGIGDNLFQHPLTLLLLAICRPSGCTVVYGVVVDVVVVVGVCNRSQMRTSKCTCLTFGVSIGLDPG